LRAQKPYFKLVRFDGEMAEWFKAHAWKACVGNTTGGSNPPLSASSNRLNEMKMVWIIFFAAILAGPSVLAENLSLREKRLRAKPKFKIEKSVANTNAVNETLVDENDFDKTLRSETRLEKTVRADKIGREPILKVSGKARQRQNTHFREWP
jgi:hypothetical protein